MLITAEPNESALIPEDQDLKIQDVTMRQGSPKSSGSYQTGALSSQSSALSSTSGTHHDEELTQERVTRLLQQANELAETGNLDSETKQMLRKLASTLAKSRAEANQYKLHLQLLSLSSKDQDMRYEVEQELIKREVDRLKNQGDQVGFLMDKVTRQKALLNKYKDKIVEKNKEIIRLRSKFKKGNPKRENGHMLDTLGLLASQVLTEENGKQ
jgi:hypothetical protein